MSEEEDLPLTGVKVNKRKTRAVCACKNLKIIKFSFINLSLPSSTLLKTLHIFQMVEMYQHIHLIEIVLEMFQNILFYFYYKH